MHLVDHARAYIHENYRRPPAERLWRAVLAFVLPHRARFRMALRLSALGRPFVPLFRGIRALNPLATMLALAPGRLPAPAPATDARVPAAKGRVALLQGCAEPVLRPEFRAAAVRLVNRCGYDVIFAAGEGCCGALVHHMGREHDSLAAARRNVDAWTREIEQGGLNAIIVTASGCGTTIKDYGHMLREDPAYAAKAARISALAKDVTEFLDSVGLPEATPGGLTVAYHPACSLQHGQKVTEAPKRLLAAAGFDVRLPAEAHLCCGSAGTYNILQPDIATELGTRKAGHLEALGAVVIATGNIGCATQIGLHSRIPVVHTVELLDWATGGPIPAAFEQA
jgi:glycolate oxidase iron-sulfur subunit